MKAVGVLKPGGPESLQVIELPEPEPGRDEIRIRVHAAAINPADTFVVAGAVPPDDVREVWVPGMDAAGIVDAIGEGVERFHVGDRVVAVADPYGAHGGAYAEKVVVPAASAALAPESASLVEASTLPMNGLTARQSLDQLALSPGDVIAVTGAAGAYGGYVVQLAKTDGLVVIADALESDRHLVASLGADHVVPRGPEVAHRIRDIVPEGVKAVADGSGQSEVLLPAVRDAGRISSVRYWSGTFERGVEVLPASITAYQTATDKLEELVRHVDAGELTLRVASIFPPEEAAEAHRLLWAGGVRGRMILTF